LFRRPYSPSSRSSSSNCSFRQGWRGVSKVFLCFRGSPKDFVAYVPPFGPDSTSSLLLSYRRLSASNRTFFLTPTAFPLRPVVLVLCPRTFRPRVCRIPFHVRMSFMKSISAFCLRTRSGPTMCMSRPVSRSFRRLKSRPVSHAYLGRGLHPRSEKSLPRKGFQFGLLGYLSRSYYCE